jgi:hypothetical protein
MTVPAGLLAKPLTVRTRFVRAVPRIAAQEGIFVGVLFDTSGDWWDHVLLWTVLDFMSQKWCFVRQDFEYENTEGGITAGSLFPPDDPEIAEVTRGFAGWC